MFLNIMLEESNRIQSLVQDLLELSKIEQNSEIPKEQISLTEIGEHSINTVSNVASKKTSTLQIISIKKCMDMVTKIN